MGIYSTSFHSYWQEVYSAAKAAINHRGHVVGYLESWSSWLFVSKGKKRWYKEGGSSSAPWRISPKIPAGICHNTFSLSMRTTKIPYFTNPGKHHSRHTIIQFPDNLNWNVGICISRKVFHLLFYWSWWILLNLFSTEIIKEEFKETTLVHKIHQLLRDESTGPEVKYNSMGLLCSLLNSGTFQWT